MTSFVLLLAAFVVSHIALATPPLRDGLVARLGENGFRIGYSLLSIGLLVLAVRAYTPLAPQPVWVAPTGLWHVSALVMLLAAILFAGSITPANKALAGVPVDDRPPSGVLAITRHPMMWAFGLWAGVHATLSGSLPTVIMALGIGALALVGAAFQDGKKRRQLGARWAAYEARTSYWPFGAQIAGRQPWRTAWPGLFPVLAGAGLWLLLTWLHPALMKAPVVPPWGFSQ